MAVTHDMVLVVNGKTITTQIDGEYGSGALIKMDTDEITLAQYQTVGTLASCIGSIGQRFGAVITSLTIGVIP